MASPVDLLALYANWCGSRLGGREDFMCFRTSFSKHFITVEVSHRSVVIEDADWCS